MVFADEAESSPGGAVAIASRQEKTLQELSLAGFENGGRDRDRTCDPYDVNVVLSR